MTLSDVLRPIPQNREKHPILVHLPQHVFFAAPAGRVSSLSLSDSTAIVILDQQTSLFARISEEKLRQLLWAFYAKATTDELLGPIFIRKIGPYPRAGWPVHIARLEGFWRAVLGGQSAYKGKPGPAHMGLGATGTHFNRWLHLWELTLTEHLPEPEVAALLSLASKMRVSLQRFAELDTP